MNCFKCGKKVDPILTFARPHGRYAKCEPCRKTAREALREFWNERREALLRALGK